MDNINKIDLTDINLDESDIILWILSNKDNLLETISPDDGPGFVYPNFDAYKSATKADLVSFLKTGWSIIDYMVDDDMELALEPPTYPNGPVDSVSYFPAGDFGVNTPTNQQDIYGIGAYNKWKSHIARTVATMGWEFAQSKQQARLTKSLSSKGAKNMKNVTENKQLIESTHPLKLHLPNNVITIHTAFKQAGKKLYVVGGAVRDALLGKDPKDFDLTTDATPTEIKQIATNSNLKYTTVGEEFGVIVVDGEEITTFRKDMSGGRRPDSVEFTDIEGDVARRDLTINALFYDIDANEVIDLVGGVSDLKNNIIRTVGDASSRFEEDSLRKLRALRFYAKFDGNFDVAIKKAIIDNPSLHDVSPERIRDEFIKSITSAKSTVKYLKAVDDLGMLSEIFPNMKCDTDFIESNDYIFQVAHLLKSYEVSEVYEYLKDIKYEKQEAYDVKVLIALSRFNPKHIFSYKKAEQDTTLDVNRIIKWGKFTKTPLEKYARFKLSVSGNEVTSLGFKGAEISSKIKSMEYDKFMNESKLTDIGVKDFRSLFDKMPKDLQTRVYGLKQVPQRPDKHPEGNTLKHTIMVVTRALKSDDIDLAIAAMFHDIGKDETGVFNPKKGIVQHIGHEKVSAALVKEYSDWITDMGANLANVFYIVKNHMKFKLLNDMRPKKQEKLKAFRAFDKLEKFGTKYDKAGLGEDISKSDVAFIDNYADAKFNPIDINLRTRHFFDRLLDPRNEKPISRNELIDFFDRLIPYKESLINVLKKYSEIVLSDKKTNINIPFVKMANQLIAKTIMRKRNFQTSNQKLSFEHINENIKTLASEIKKRLDLHTFALYEKNNDIYLDSLIVKKDAQKKGTGTEAMQSLIDYADTHGKRIILTPGLADKHHGTTSRNRLIKFYKEFGFVESKGRNIDYAIGAGKMYRVPLTKEQMSGIDEVLQYVVTETINSTLLNWDKYHINKSDTTNEAVPIQTQYTGSTRAFGVINPSIGELPDGAMDGGGVGEDTSNNYVSHIDKVRGGVGDDLNILDISKKHGVSIDDIKYQFEMGISVERVHTRNNITAAEIVLDNLTNDPEYYTKLSTTENNLKEHIKRYEQYYTNISPESFSVTTQDGKIVIDVAKHS